MKKFFILLLSIVTLIEPAFAQAQLSYIGRVKEDRVFIYGGQHLNYEKVALMNKGDELSVLLESYGWLKVKLPLESNVYVKAEHVQMLNERIGQIKVDKLNARASANTESSILGKLSQGTKISIREIKGEWLLIQPTDDLFGWVKAEWIEKTSKTPKTRLYAEPVIEEKKEAVLKMSSDFIKELTPTQVEVIGFLIKEEDVYVLKGESGADRIILKGPDSMLAGFQQQKVKVIGRISSQMINGTKVLDLVKILIFL